MAFCIALLTYQIGKRVSWPMALAGGYTLLNALATFGLPNLYRFPDGSEYSYSFLKTYVNSVHTYAQYLTLVVFFMSIPARLLERIVGAMPAYSALNALYVVAGKWVPWIGNQPIVDLSKPGFIPELAISGQMGALDCNGMNGTLIGLGAGPILFARWPWWMRVFTLCLCLYAIALSGASIPYGVFALSAVGSITHAGWNFIRRIVLVGFATLALCVPGILGFVMERSEFLNPNGRLGAWEVFMREWYGIGHYWIGLGPGSFMGLQEQIQRKTMFGVSGQIIWQYFAIHSDFLQCLFQLGVIGLVLYLILTADVGRKLWGLLGGLGSSLFGIYCGLIGAGVLYFPTQYFVTASLITLVIVSAYRLPEPILSTETPRSRT